MMRNYNSKTFFKLFLSLSFLYLFHTASYGQKLESWMKAGDHSFFVEKDYRTAFNYYQAASAYDSTRIDIWVKMAESARNMQGLQTARTIYDRVLLFPDSILSAENFYYSAWVNMRLGDYKGVQKNLQSYFRKAKDGDPFKSQAILLESSSNQILKNFASYTNIPEQTKKLSTSNDCLEAEFGAVSFKDNIIYAKFSEKERVTSKSDTIAFVSNLRLMTGNQGDTSWMPQLAVPNKIISGLSFLPENKGLYYCLCDKVNLMNVRCDIYYRKLNDNGEVSEPLKIKANESGFSTQHPAVGKDINGNLWLYFSSNRPGGKGKDDLYRGRVLENGDVETIENLSFLNTSEEDVTPFFHSKTQRLYFSTQGRFTFGGFDVYASSTSGNDWTNPMNMGVQMNASSDDLFFALSEKGSNGWLTVRGEKGSACTTEMPDACCYNLVSWEMPRRRVRIIARNANDSAIISDANLSVKLLPNGQSDQFEVSYGNWPYLSWNTTDNHEVGIQSDGFDPYKENLSIEQYPYTGDTVEIEVYLKPTVIELQVLTFDDRTKAALNGSTVTLSKLMINEKTEDNSQTNTNGNSFVFSVIQNHKYKLVASKDNYESVEMPISFTLNDVRGMGRKITIEVYLKPPLSAPVALYFDNDIPKASEMKIKGTENYIDLANKYYNQKESFISNFTQVLPENEKFVLKEQYDLFFDREVKMGNISLEYLANAILGKLSEGKKLEITINGFASPLGGATSNKLLSDRRVKTVHNYLLESNQAKLAEYVKNGQLKLIKSAFGEGKSDKKVSDNPKDKRNSVFSLVASVERRVEILVKILN
jgi:outer membrane protein OmpA-like peptidoglycan-associated protein